MLSAKQMKLILLKVFTALSLFSSISCTVYLSPSSLNIEPNNAKITEKWRKSGEIMEPLIWPHRRPLIDVLQKVVNEANSGLSVGCNRSLSLALEGLQNRDLWAYEMMDASGKFSPGFMSTQYTDFGDFDQCLAIDVNSQLDQFSGKYCLYRINFPLPKYDKHSPANMSLFGKEIEGKWLQRVAKTYKALYTETINNAICVPSTCSSKEIKILLEKYVFQSPLKVKFWSECDTKETISIPFNQQPFYTQISAIILVAWASFVMMSTLLILVAPSICPEGVSSLSIVSNSQKVFREPSTTNPMETLVVPTKLTFTVVGFYVHVYACTLLHGSPAFSVNQVSWSESGFGTLTHTIMSNLDIFNTAMFTLSGMMTYYIWHDIMDKMGGKLRFGTYVIPRLLRCYPLVIIPTLVTMAFPLVPGMGPIYRQSLENMAAKAYRYLVYDLMFATNLPYLHVTQMSHLITWGISVDVHLYISSFYAIYLLYNKPKKGLILTFGMLFGSMVAQGVVMYIMDTSASFDILAVDIKRTFDDGGIIYFSTLSNAPSFYIGILGGYCFANKMTVSNNSRILGWLGLISIYVFFGMYFVQYARTEHNRALQYLIIIGILRKTLICLLVLWLGYSFYYKERPFVYLSHVKPFVYFSRMFGSINMCHYHILGVIALNARKPFEPTSVSLAQREVIVLSTALVFGYIVHVLFEAPLNNLTTRFLLKETQTMKSTKTN